MSSVPHLKAVGSVSDLVDWGPIAMPLQGSSRTAGRLLHKNDDGSSECGIWVCTPGEWRCEVTRDEFCHFLAGRCTYTDEAGEVTTIEPGTIAFFRAGWRGTCRVTETVRKVYMIR
jgi:uncharacterized cupin superfamily protein